MARKSTVSACPSDCAYPYYLRIDRIILLSKVGLINQAPT